MKPPIRIWFSIFISFVLFLSIFTVVHANAAAPPVMTVIVPNPPDDLSISLLIPDGDQSVIIELERDFRFWEAYFRVYYHSIPSFESINLDDVVLLVQSNEKNFECSLPSSTFNKYNFLLTLDMNTESLSIGKYPYREIPLVILRVILTLLLEGFVFWLFGYRKKRSWIVFLSANLITQVGLNALFIGPNLGAYWVAVFIFCEILVVLVELILFSLLIKEFRKRRTILYVIIANLFSWYFGGILLINLPV